MRLINLTLLIFHRTVLKLNKTYKIHWLQMCMPNPNTLWDADDLLHRTTTSSTAYMGTTRSPAHVQTVRARGRMVRPIDDPPKYAPGTTEMLGSSGNMRGPSGHVNGPFEYYTGPSVVGYAEQNTIFFTNNALINPQLTYL